MAIIRNQRADQATYNGDGTYEVSHQLRSAGVYLVHVDMLEPGERRAPVRGPPVHAMLLTVSPVRVCVWDTRGQSVRIPVGRSPFELVVGPLEAPSRGAGLALRAPSSEARRRLVERWDD